MFERTATTWSLMKSSWNVLKSDKELIIFPLFSCISMILVLASFGSSYFWAPEFWHSIGQNLDKNIPRDQQHLPPLGYVVMFLFYFCNYAVIAFFNTGLIFCALTKMNGGNATAKDGLKEARKRLPQIFGWALLAASIGMILRLIAERSNLVGKIVTSLIGVVFSIASYLVIPVMVAENKGPIDALKESAELFKKTWGKQFKGSISFSGLFILLLLPVFIVMPLVIIVFHSNVILLSLGIGALVAYMVILMLGQATLAAIFQAALYIYGKTGAAPVGYNKDDLYSSVNLK